MATAKLLGGRRLARIQLEWWRMPEVITEIGGQSNPRGSYLVESTMVIIVVVMATVLAPNNGGRKMEEWLPAMIQTVMAVRVGGDGFIVIRRS